MSTRLLPASVALAALSFSFSASAITREEALVRARSYASHPWHAASANMTASCKAAYTSVYTPGDFVGLPYNWGGYQTLFDFDQKILNGYAAGAQPSDGVLACTAGVDCSGFVSMAWSVGHYNTSSIPSATSVVLVADMLPGDVFNKAGYHVAMYAKTMASGEPLLIEAYGYNVNTNATGGFSHVSGYIPRRLPALTGTTVGNPFGTATNPIDITAFPYTDSRDTRLSMSDVIDGCGASPAVNQSGPEYIYRATFTQPGTLSVSVADDAATDIDVQLLTSLNTSACVARNDVLVTKTVGCGTYFVIADTYGTGTAAGPYTLNATFTPSGQPCSAVPGPPAFNPSGELGDACGYPANPSLPFCNANLGADTCIYTSTNSFCSKPCAVTADCAGMPGGAGCCEDIGSSELYCMTQSMCGSGGSVSADAGAGPGGGGMGGGSGGGTGGGANVDAGTGGPGGDMGGGNSADPTTGDGTPAGGSSTANGCTFAPSGPQGIGPLLIGLLGIGVRIFRRRRSRRRWPHALML